MLNEIERRLKNESDDYFLFFLADYLNLNYFLTRQLKLLRSKLPTGYFIVASTVIV